MYRLLKRAHRCVAHFLAKTRRCNDAVFIKKKRRQREECGIGCLFVFSSITCSSQNKDLRAVYEAVGNRCGYGG